MALRLPRASVLALAIAIACSSTNTSEPAASGFEIQPAAADVFVGDSVKFQAFAHGAVATVTWSVMEAGGGTVDADGNYVAPEMEGTFHVVAFVDDQTEPAIAAVRVTRRPGSDAIGVSIRPKAASISSGELLALAATVSGTADASVTWSVEEGASGGTVTSAGVYTAPQASGTYHVVAQSSVDPRQSDRATITVTAPSPGPAGPQFYVATDGSDSNPGTAAQPWRTIQKAMNSATPGSIVSIRGGTYREALTVNVSGTAGNPITFQSHNGERVLIDWSGFGYRVDNPLFAIYNQHDIIIRGLEFANWTTTGPMQRAFRIWGNSANIDFVGNSIHDLRNAGPLDGQHAMLTFHVNDPVRNFHFRGNEVYNIHPAYGEAFTISTGGGTIVDSNYFHGIYNIAVDVLNYGSMVGSNVKILNNYMEDIRGTISQGIAFYVSGGNNVTLEGNVVRNAPDAYAYEVAVEPGYAPTYDIIIRDNIAYGNYAALMVGDWYGGQDSRMYNVTATGNLFADNANGIVTRPYGSNVNLSGNTLNAGTAATGVWLPQDWTPGYIFTTRPW